MRFRLVAQRGYEWHKGVKSVQNVKCYAASFMFTQCNFLCEVLAKSHIEKECCALSLLKGFVDHL